MAMMLAFDPGLSGAIALMNAAGKLLRVWDMPTLPRAHGKGNEVNPFLLADIVGEAKEMADTFGSEMEAVVELVGPQPRDGTAGAFKFGDSFGVIRGILGARYIKTSYYRPQAWKKWQGLLKKDKAASRALAVEKWPEMRDEFRRVKDADRAEAALLGEFGLNMRIDA